MELTTQFFTEMRGLSVGSCAQCQQMRQVNIGLILQRCLDALWPTPREWVGTWPDRIGLSSAPTQCDYRCTAHDSLPASREVSCLGACGSSRPAAVTGT
jgi:hypothetical protein